MEELMRQLVHSINMLGIVFTIEAIVISVLLGYISCDLNKIRKNHELRKK